MSNSPEIINLDFEKIDINKSSPSIKITPSSPTLSQSKSVNFGPGAEMLMNNSKKSSSSSSSEKNEINIDDLNNLEDELNNLTNTPKNTISSDDKPIEQSNIKLNFDEPPPIKIPKNDTSKDTTWDGYKKFNEIPVNPEANVPKNTGPTMTSDQKKTLKSKYLRRLEQLKRKGEHLSKQFTQEDSYEDIKIEYDNIIEDKKKKSSIKWQGHAMMALVRGLETFNSHTDWFGIDLDGWGESVSENIDDFDDVFEELHHKYSGSIKAGPEISLLMQLAGSGIMVNMTNTLFKSSMPGMEDIMRQNPDLMKQFTQAAANTMGESNPGFGQFMDGVMNSNNKFEKPEQSQRRVDLPPGPRTNATDVGMDRGYPQFNDTVDINDSYGSFNQPPPQQQQRSNRPDMKGPSDISDLLSGLKNKTNNISQPKEVKMENGSTISIEELKSISKDADNVPRKSKRKPRSERNTVSLDI